MNNIIAFNDYAVQAGLSTETAWLWVRIYATMTELGQWDDVSLPANDLAAQIGLSRSGYYRVRQPLIERGLISVRRVGKKILYTMDLNWQRHSQNLHVVACENYAEENDPMGFEEPIAGNIAAKSRPIRTDTDLLQNRQEFAEQLQTCGKISNMQTFGVLCA